MARFYTCSFLLIAILIIPYSKVFAQKKTSAVIYPLYTADCTTSPEAAMAHLLNFNRGYCFDSSMTHLYRQVADTGYFEYALYNYPNKYPGSTPPGNDPRANAARYDVGSKLANGYSGGIGLSIGRGRKDLPFTPMLTSSDNKGSKSYTLLSLTTRKTLALITLSFNDAVFPDFIYANINQKLVCYILITSLNGSNGTGRRTYYLWPLKLDEPEVQTFTPATVGQLVSFEKPVINYDNFLSDVWLDEKAESFYFNFNYSGSGDSLLQWKIQQNSWTRSQFKTATFAGYPKGLIPAGNGMVYKVESEVQKRTYESKPYINEFEIGNAKPKKQYKIPIDDIQNIGLSANTPFCAIYNVNTVKIWNFKEGSDPFTLFLPRLGDRGYSERDGNLKYDNTEKPNTRDYDYLQHIEFSADGRSVALIWFYGWHKYKTDAYGKPFKENGNYVTLKGYREFIDVYELPRH